jgi:LPXTG-motif cell wall-anchored protein
MVKSMRSRARPFKVAASAFLVLFVFGVTAPAYADAGDNGRGSENSNAAANSNAGGNGADNGKAVGKADSSSSTTTDQSATGAAGTGGTSGDTSRPQPISNADANEGGANGQCPGGPYCSTRDGSPSKNGKGDGKAVGKPCAGCVGKADNKNPPGQMPNGKDHNAGYECDRNQGIGKTNPAHTGCKPAQPKPPEEEKPNPPEKPKPPEEEKPKPPEKEKPKPPEKPAPEVVPAPRPPAVVTPAAVTPAAVAPAQVLPPTGASTLETALGLGGAAMLLAGALLVRRRRTS